MSYLEVLLVGTSTFWDWWLQKEKEEDEDEEEEETKRFKYTFETVVKSFLEHAVLSALSLPFLQVSVHFRWYMFDQPMEQ